MGRLGRGTVLASSSDAVGRARAVCGWRYRSAAVQVAGPRMSMSWSGMPAKRSARGTPASSGGISGGIAHIRTGPWRVWFKVGLQGSHQHADLGHVSIEHDGRWVVVDPGTGTYNGPLGDPQCVPDQPGHNGIRVQDGEILIPHRAFRWLNSPHGTCAPAHSG